jgi:hypothetical protein
MAEVNKDEAAELLALMRQDIKKLLSKHAKRASKLAVNSYDPHTPVIGCMQMALAVGAFEYLVKLGMPASAALQTSLETTGNAMREWIKTLQGPGSKEN